MENNSGFCSIPAVYLETVGLPAWRIKQWLRSRELDADEIGEIEEAIDDCITVDGPSAKPIVVVSEFSWEVLNKREFHNEIQLD